MKTPLCAVLLAAMPTCAAGQVTATQQSTAPSQASTGAASAALPPGTLIQAELGKTIDAKKAKQGDPVAAKTTNDVAGAAGMVIPRGSRLIGHVIAVKPSSKDSRESSLAISFDKAVLKGNREVPLHALIQAAAPPDRPANFSAQQQGGDISDSGSTGGAPSPTPMGGPPSPMGGPSGGTMGSAGGARHQPSAPGAPSGSAGGAPGSVAPVDTGGRLSPRASGALGLSGVTLSTGDNAQASVFSSQKGNVRLDGGTQLILRVTQ